MVLIEQISALIDFMESHPQMALGQKSRSLEMRMEGNRRWAQCATLLNSISPDCPNKSVNEWRKYFNEYKHKLVKKIKLQKQEMRATGGGPGTKINLTPYEERLYTILGRDLGDPLEGVRPSRVQEQSPTTTREQGPSSVQEQSPTTTREQGPSRVQEQGPTTTWEHRPHRVQEQGPTTTLEHRPSRVPPARASRTRVARLRHARQHPNTEEINHAALEASQERLERMESRNAAAIRNLSEAIDRLGESTLEAANNMAAATTQAAGILAAAIERVAHCFNEAQNKIEIIDMSPGL